MRRDTVIKHPRVECARCGLVVPAPLFGGLPRGWVGYDKGSAGACVCQSCFNALVDRQQKHFNCSPPDARAQVINALMQTGPHKGDETWQETRRRLIERSENGAGGRSRKDMGEVPHGTETEA